MKENRLKTFLTVLLLSLAIALSSAIADEKRKSKEELSDCEGFLYRAKREGVPVYREPDTTAKVIYKLKLGEKVCYVGEQKNFAILDWTVQKKGTDKKKDEKLAFVRLVELWEPRDKPSGGIRRPADFFERAKQYINYMMHGGVPEDPLLPYRPLIGPFQGDVLTEEDQEKECPLEEQ